MDVLSSLVSLLRLRGDLYGRLALGAPFSLRFPSEVGHYLLVLSGRARLVMLGEEHVLSPGDFVFIPSSDPFSLVSDTPDRPPVRDFSENEGRAYHQDGLIRTEGDHARGCELLSGCFHFAPHETDLLIDQMPAPLVHSINASDSAPWLASVFDVVNREMSAARPGASSIIDRMLEIMLIEALRHKIHARSTGAAAWLAALQDQRIGRVLHRIHFAPHENWTVARLAEVAGMSRSSFATLFHALTGRTPMEHLARWRMQRAAHFLTDGQSRSVSEVIERVGYRSEAAFRRQFADVFGQSPNAYRSAREGGRVADPIGSPPPQLGSSKKVPNGKRKLRRQVEGF